MDLETRIKRLSRERLQLLRIRAKKSHASSEKQDFLPNLYPSRESIENPGIANQSPSKNRLTAYLVLKKGETLDASEIRNFLRARLPYYMIPNNFLFLESIPLGPNAKVDRQALARMVPVIQTEKASSDDEPRNVVEEKLAIIWGEVLGIQRVGIHDNFFELGGDSIISIQIISKAKQAGLKLTANQIFQNQSIAELAPIVESQSPMTIQQKIIKGKVPLCPIQKWFFSQQLPHPEHWNQAVLLEPDPGISFEVLQQALSSLVKHHDNLRSNFRLENGFWQQSIHPSHGLPVIEEIDFSKDPDQSYQSLISTYASKAHATLNLKEGRLVHGIFFRTGDRQYRRILLIIHHLVMDAISWQIVLEDLEQACKQILAGERISLPAKSTSFKAWSERLQDYAQSEIVRNQIPYWTREQLRKAAIIPVDTPSEKESNTVLSVKKESNQLSMEESRILVHEISQVYHTKINEILLTALLQTYFMWSEHDCLLLGLEGHGREELFENIDISRTVGWFTTYFPIFLKLQNPSDPEQSIVETKEQLRSIPLKGLGYGLLRYCSRDLETKTALKAVPEPQICFNYLGSLVTESFAGSLLKMTSEPTGEARNRNGKRPYLLEINTFILEDQLTIDCFYSQNFHDKTTINNFVSIYIKNLRHLIQHCQSPTAGKFSPSDFPESGLNQGELDNFISQITD